MTFLHIPKIEYIVVDSCRDLINQYGFLMKVIAKNEVTMVSAKCGIRIIAGISPIGEQQIEIDFFNPVDREAERKYVSDTFLLYINTRAEPRDVLDNCIAQQERTQATFEETIRITLTCFTAHTLKYRTDILNGDFTSWLPRNV